MASSTVQKCFSSSRSARRVIKARCSAAPESLQCTRRAAMASVLLLAPLAAVPAAMARDVKEAQKEREARRAALREAAEKSKATGRDSQVFAMPEYSMSEAARTPNVHTRQEEGARTQENV